MLDMRWLKSSTWPYSLLWEDCGRRRRLRPNLAGESPSACFERTRRCWSACEACFLRRSWPVCQPGEVRGGVWRGAVGRRGAGGGGSERCGRKGVERGTRGANANNAAACRAENRRTVDWIASCCILQALCSGKLVRWSVFTLLESDSAGPCEPIGHLRHFAMPSAHHVHLQGYLGRYPPLLHLVVEVR
jgi:hypothetical protein